MSRIGSARARAGEAAGELRKKECRVCGREYEYPLPRSPATRLYCETCVGLPAEVRKVLEQFRREIKRLQRQVEALRAK